MSFFILWINEPTIVIGKHQNVKIEEINKAYTDEHGIHKKFKQLVCIRLSRPYNNWTTPLFP